MTKRHTNQTDSLTFSFICFQNQSSERCIVSALAEVGRNELISKRGVAQFGGSTIEANVFVFNVSKL